MNTEYRKPLPGTDLDYFDTRQAVEDIQAGAYDKLPYTSKILAEQLVRRCDPEMLTDSLKQLIERKRDLDFPWYPARVVCHDILGQTALVDLAGLRDAIAEKGGDPAKVNPVVPTQLIVDHSLAVEHAGFEKDAFEKNRQIEDRRNDDRFHFINWTKTAFKNVDVIPPAMASCTRSTWRKCPRWFRTAMVLLSRIPVSALTAIRRWLTPWALFPLV